MPSILRRVDFDPIPAFSRPAGDDELYVMRNYVRHAGHCAHCGSPLEIYSKGGTLCDRGHLYALNVSQYLYYKGGAVYSQVDRERGQRVQVEIPATLEVITDLLRAVAQGMRLRQDRPVISYDDTEMVERRPAEKLEPIYHVIEPARRGRQGKRRPDSVYVADRGSLFEIDQVERRERRQDALRVRAPRDYHR